MKYADIQKIREADLISDDQRQKIIEHFKLKEEDNKFLIIISSVGAILVVAGLILLVASNWAAIPRGIKIAGGLLLMLGAHTGGWYLREVRGSYLKTGEALHLIGSGLFLGNIALIGQIYHISSRPPNALLLWWAGIAALPWLLRSKAQHVLALPAFGIWFGMEANQEGSPIHFGDEYQILLYSLLGLIYLGGGYALRGTAFAEFAPATEKLGLIGFHIFAYPMIWGFLYRNSSETRSSWVFPVMSAATLALLGIGAMRLQELTRQWRWTWLAALAGAIGLLAGAIYLEPLWGTEFQDLHSFGYHWIAAIGLFIFCLLQIQVGIQERSAYMINLGIVFIALDIITTYFVLFGSMARTGAMFLISGIFLIVFGVYLEKKRRALMKQIVQPLNG